jgi:hypothetical protein
MWISRIVLAVAMMIVTVSASAQQRSRPTRPKPEVHDLDGITISGDRDVPSSTYTLVPSKPGFPVRIKLRANFVPELQDSTDAL